MEGCRSTASACADRRDDGSADSTGSYPRPEAAVGHDDSVASGLSPPVLQGRSLRRHGACGCTRCDCLLRADGLVRTVRPLTEANATIARVRRLLLGLTLGGALAAGSWAGLAANAVLRPVRALAGTVRKVSATRDLNQRIPVSGRDELASLAADFNAMLAALDESQQAQQQLIADASHELRTPLTAHRANIELLARPDLPVERRQRVLGAAVRGIEELSTLVGDLIQAARDGRSVDAREPLALDELVAAAVERARHRASGLRFESRLEPLPACRGPLAAGARGRQRPRQRDQVEPARQHRRHPARRGTADSARPRARHRRGRPAARLRPLLPGRRRLAPCPARGSGSRSSSRPSTTTAAASPSPTRTAEGRSSRSASTPTAETLSKQALSNLSDAGADPFRLRW